MSEKDKEEERKRDITIDEETGRVTVKCAGFMIIMCEHTHITEGIERDRELLCVCGQQGVNRFPTLTSKHSVSK